MPSIIKLESRYTLKAESGSTKKSSLIEIRNESKYDH
jgi:hypothetical protein